MVVSPGLQNRVSFLEKTYSRFGQGGGYDVRILHGTLRMLAFAHESRGALAKRLKVSLIPSQITVCPRLGMAGGGLQVTDVHGPMSPGVSSWAFAVL